MLFDDQLSTCSRLHCVPLQNQAFAFTGLSAECIMSQVRLNAKGDAPDGLSLALLTLGKQAEVKS